MLTKKKQFRRLPRNNYKINKRIRERKVGGNKEDKKRTKGGSKDIQRENKEDKEGRNIGNAVVKKVKKGKVEKEVEAVIVEVNRKEVTVDKDGKIVRIDIIVIPLPNHEVVQETDVVLKDDLYDL